MMSIGQCATLACIMEATAPKPGNVHRGADFSDTTFTDFAVSAALIGPAIESVATEGVGRAVHNAVAATRPFVPTNTNLGMCLLMAPLAAVPRDQRLTSANVRSVLRSLKPDDCRLVYEAIRLAQPGGLGKAETMDVADQPPDLVPSAFSQVRGTPRLVETAALLRPREERCERRRLFGDDAAFDRERFERALERAPSTDDQVHFVTHSRGLQWGQAVADAIWAWRSTDGFTPAPPPFLGGTNVGQWRPTPPGNLPGAGPQFR
jgi:hypothetical protein